MRRPCLGSNDRRLLRSATSIIGVDEVDRGCLAGRVVVCGVRFAAIARQPLVQDLKTLSARQREQAAAHDRQHGGRQQVVAYAGTGGGSYLIERRRAGEIRSAFSKYVSGQVVEEMIEHPERLTLGGQRREITVLFSDLAGFTTLSERLAPDAVGKLINVYLNAMTRIIMDHQGTVDKFIGDAVMAEWGAPLDDPEHAEHGVRAALAMQQRMAELQPQFRTFGIEALHLRIGLNSGAAIVGNMGSDLLFDYTALGDTVNLASRLEGVNKLYGTPILISAETASRLEGGIGLRPGVRAVPRCRDRKPSPRAARAPGGRRA